MQKLSKNWILNSLIMLGILLFINVDNSYAATFKDVTEKHANSTEIEFLVEQGIIKGYSDNSFQPENNVTNAQVAIMIARTLELDLENRPNPNFIDVSKKLDSFQAIAAVVDEGIFPDGKMFYPNKPITREKMAYVLVKAFELSGKSDIKFKDVSTKDSYYAVINTLAANNITTGYTDGTFKPENPLTRSHFCAFLARVLEPDFIPVSNKFGYNKDYKYTYQYVEDNGRTGNDYFTFKKTDQNIDSWLVSDENGSGINYQNIINSKGFKFISPKQGDMEEYLDFYIPYPVKLGSTWKFANSDDYLPVTYTVTSMSETIETAAKTFNNVMEIISSDGYSYYFEPNLGHILTYDLENDETVYELIELKKN